MLAIPGGVFLTLGIVLGFITCGLMIWGDLEASMFTNGIFGDVSMKGLNCPVIITTNEIGTISAVIKNPDDKSSDRFLRAFISEGYATLSREIKTKVPLSPSGKNKVEWKIRPEDAAFSRVVLFRIYVNAKYPYPSMSGNCGVIRVNIPWLSGGQLFSLLSTISFLLLAIGAFLWEIGIFPAAPKQRKRCNAVYFLIGILVATSIMSYLGWWLLGILGVAVAAILVGVIVFRC